MTKNYIINTILADRSHSPQRKIGTAFAPSNIALCKYWGKRDLNLNLPVTSSLSISLGTKGTTVTVRPSDLPHDVISINDKPIDGDSDIAKRLSQYLDLFRSQNHYFQIDSQSNIPIAAGLASSASSFAALVKALDQYFDWQLQTTELSILARLGSGSACRSLWQGFVKWYQGHQTDGMDSHGIALTEKWPDLRIGLLIIDHHEKAISSRQAMEHTKLTSPLYAAWPDKVHSDITHIKAAIHHQDFELFGKTAESNALTMHATMMASWSPIVYWQPKTIALMQQIWSLRAAGLPVYFTQDAGPNLKLLFLAADTLKIKQNFPSVDIIQPFSYSDCKMS